MRLLFGCCLLASFFSSISCKRNETFKVSVARSNYQPYSGPIPGEVFIRVNSMLDKKYEHMNVVVYPSEWGYNILVAAAGPIPEDTKRAASLAATDAMIQAIKDDLESAPK